MRLRTDDGLDLTAWHALATGSASGITVLVLPGNAGSRLARVPLARALAALEPAPPALNRDRLMLEAGAASRRPVIRLWQLTAGLLAAVGFAAGLNWRPLAGVREQAAAGQVAAPARPEAALRERVLVANPARLYGF